MQRKVKGLKTPGHTAQVLKDGSNTLNRAESLLRGEKVKVGQCGPKY